MQSAPPHLVISPIRKSASPIGSSFLEKGAARHQRTSYLPNQQAKIGRRGFAAPARKLLGETISMKMTSAFRTALVALIAVAASSTKSLADSGYVTLTIYKAGWVIGGSGGSGTLKFRGRTYGLSTGGLDYGLVFGGSKTVLRGRVTNIDRPSDVAGVYGAAGAGLAVGSGARAIVLTNQKGAVLELSGKQVGLLANLDLSGLAITLK
jgi:hypothetical protein